MKKRKLKKLIEAAIEAHGKGFQVNGCSVEMNLDVGEVVTELAEAMTQQAIANRANSEAMAELARKLVPTDVTGISITQT